MRRQPFEPLEPALYRETVRRALAEDLGWGDVTTAAIVRPDARGLGRVCAGAACVLAGLDVAAEAFRQLDPMVVVTGEGEDGRCAAEGEAVLELRGLAAPMLTAERTARNFLERLSAIATSARRFTAAAGGRTLVLDTRRTSPLLRSLEKYAVRAGGGTNHRLSLDEGVLVTRNHVRLAGGAREALERMARAGHDLPIEIQVTSLDELDEALAAGAQRVLADGFGDAALPEVVRRTRGRAQVEISGGVTLARMEAIASLGPDFVSAGALTHAAPPVRFDFTIEPES